MTIFTQEQKDIIQQHPIGQHARVLAVAGSGKTTTMVQRVKHLVTNLNQDPKLILVVMFNKLAKLDFERKIEREIFEVGLRPKIYTFHGLAHKLRQDAAKQEPTIGRMESWFGDTAELAFICMDRAIRSLLREGLIDDEVDPKDALDAVGLWKAALIPPERAGHRLNPDMPLIYRRFEELRMQTPAITFDDFIPEAMKLFDRVPAFRRRWSGRMKHIIVDEYQDINYGQQQLIRLLAGDRADVMVVGDDDQTIYEWRGARPYYILKGFREDFSDKPVKDYTLSHSFRFGPLIAQSAFNTIRFNQQRAEKPLIAHNVQRNSGLTVLTDESEQATQISISMGQEISTLVRKQRIEPDKIAVLGRTFVQLEGLQTIFVRHKLPFRVLGMRPFFERHENRTLIDYIRLAQALDLHAGKLRPWRSIKAEEDTEDAYQPRHRPVHARSSPYQEAVRLILAVANTPSRMLPRDRLQAAVEQGGGRAGYTVGRSLESLLDPTESPLREKQRASLRELIDILRRINERINAEPNLKAADLLVWIMQHTDYEKHYARQYGEGEASVERISSVRNFVDFAQATGHTVLGFVDFLNKLDPTLGRPPNEIITMTTVHRTKGLEYEYVFIPACTEGNMPVYMAQAVEIYDKSGQVPDHPPSPALESERRLFYVAATRAVKHLYIGTIRPPQRGQQSQSGTALPSRFLDEIQLEPTQALIGSLQGIYPDASPQSPVAADRLLNAVRQVADQHKLIASFLQNYLASPDWSRVNEEINKLLKQTQERPFSYRFEYPDIENRGPKPGNQALDPPAWSDPWAEIGITI